MKTYTTYEIKIRLTTSEETSRGWISGFIKESLKGIISIKEFKIKTIKLKKQ